MDREEFTQLIARDDREDVDHILDQLEELVSEESTLEELIMAKIIGEYTVTQTAIYWNHQDIDCVRYITERAQKFVQSTEFTSSILLSLIYYNIASFIIFSGYPKSRSMIL